MRKINRQTGEIHSIRVKGLWAPYPIPAVQVLAEQEEWLAMRVLLALVSYLGDNGYKIYPTYDQISRRCGVARNGIRKSLDVLELNGFLITLKNFKKNRANNVYFIQEAAWETSKMNSYASKFRPKRAKCLDCKSYMDEGGYGISSTGVKTHLGCGGPVREISETEKKRIS
jgi:Helix-turn-helix domain